MLVMLELVMPNTNDNNAITNAGNAINKNASNANASTVVLRLEGLVLYCRSLSKRWHEENKKVHCALCKTNTLTKLIYYLLIVL